MKRTNNAAFFSSLLLQWHAVINKRTMPWKGEKDPYKIWLSEIILQQTRVDQGLNYYLKFIKKYPTVHKLANAKDNDIFKMWEGLGYYSRCKNLITTARFISSSLRGIFPTTFDEILQLKGVGPYTASAIASFAFDLPYAVVDGNVNRVIARYFGIHIPIDSTEGKKKFSELAASLLDKQNPGLYNQAIMDFGATICKPQLPLCSRCFLAAGCKAYNENTIDLLPVKEKRIVRKNRWFYYLVIEKEGKLLIRKRAGKDIWQNLHEFVLIEATARIEPAKLLNSKPAKEIIKKPYQLLETTDFFKQSLTHQDIHGCFMHIRVDGNSLVEGYDFMSIKAVSQLAFPKLLNDYLIIKGWRKK
jgi:A/G-specific adenine glycosylase